MRDRDEPTLTVQLGLDVRLCGPATDVGAFADVVSRDVESSVDRLLEDLGVPGGTSVTATLFAPRPGLASGELLEVTIDGEPCPYPEELLVDAYCYASGRPAGAVTSAGAILDALAAAAEAPERLRRQFLALACTEVLKENPEHLMGSSAQARAYLTALALPTEIEGVFRARPEILLEALRAVLRLRVSLADRSAVSRVLQTEAATDLIASRAGERLIAALRPAKVEVVLSEEYLRQLTTLPHAVSPTTPEPYGGFARVRDELFYQLGVTCPEFALALADTPQPRSFAFRIGHLTTLPRIGLRPGQLLVNAEPRDAKSLGSAEPAADPSTRESFAVIDVEGRPEAIPEELTAWSALDYVMCWLKVELVRRAGCFVDERVVTDHLDRLAAIFPALVSAARAQVPCAELTTVLRGLVAEESPIRDLRVILESVLACEIIQTDATGAIVLDDRLPLRGEPDASPAARVRILLAFVRMCMKREITHRRARGRRTLPAYLVDAEIARRLLDPAVRGARPLNRDEREAIVSAVAARVPSAAGGDAQGAILTTADARLLLRELVARRFPRLAIVAYQELSPDVSIQPLAQITVAAEAWPAPDVGTIVPS